MGRIEFPETSENNYECTLRNIRGKWSPQLLECGESLKSCRLSAIIKMNIIRSLNLLCGNVAGSYESVWNTCSNRSFLKLWITFGTIFLIGNPFRTMFFSRWDVFDPRTYPQPEWPQAFGSAAPHVQYIRSCPSRMEAVCSIRKLWMPQNLLTGIKYCHSDTRGEAAF